MPIEIKELIIEASLAREDDRGEESTNLLTEEDAERITEDIIQQLRGGGISAADKRAIIAEMKREVRQMLEAQWRG